MKKKIPKTLVLLTIMIVLIIASMILTKDEKTPVDESKKIEAPQIQKFDNNTTRRIDYKINLTNIDLPTSLPVYFLSEQGLTDKQLGNMVSNLGFSNTEPVVNNDPLFGPTHIYYSNQASLRLIPTMKLIDYKTDNFSENELPPDLDRQEIENLAMDFIVNNNLVSNPETLVVNKYQKLYREITGEPNTSKQPNMVNINFNKTIGDYQIISATFETGIANFVFNAEKQIISAYIDDIPQIGDSEEYPIKSLDEIRNEIQNSAQIQSIEDGIINPIYLNTNSLLSAQIDEVEIVYFQELSDNQNLLQPNLKLKGTVEIRDIGTKEAIFLMPAISSEYFK